MIHRNVYYISFLWLCFIKHSNGTHTHTHTLTRMVFTGGASGEESACQLRRYSFDHLVRKTRWGRTWQHTPVLVPRQCHGQSRLVGYCPLGCKKSDITEQLNTHTHTHTHTHTYIHSLIYIKMTCKLQTQNHFLCNCKLFSYHYTYLKLYMHTCISLSIYLSISQLSVVYVDPHL